MKITSKKIFTPVNICLESPEEVRALAHVVNQYIKTQNKNIPFMTQSSYTAMLLLRDSLAEVID